MPWSPAQHRLFEAAAHKGTMSDLPKPVRKWFFKQAIDKDRRLVVLASMDFGDFARPSLVLPASLTDEYRDLLLWAFERGHTLGTIDGTARIRAHLQHIVGDPPELEKLNYYDEPMAF